MQNANAEIGAGEFEQLALTPPQRVVVGARTHAKEGAPASSRTGQEERFDRRTGLEKKKKESEPGARRDGECHDKQNAARLGLLAAITKRGNRVADFRVA